MNIDLTCQDCPSGYRITDLLLDPKYRTQRYKEYLALKQLPFYSIEQHNRFRVLKQLRLEDNQAAFREDYYGSKAR